MYFFFFFIVNFMMMRKYAFYTLKTGVILMKLLFLLITLPLDPNQGFGLDHWGLKATPKPTTLICYYNKQILATPLCFE